MPEQNIDTRPPPPSWLDQELIETALRTGDNDPDIRVISCDFSMANSAGDGYLSNMYRAVAKLQGGNERRLVIKCQPKGGKLEDMTEKARVYERETKMFSETLPAMQKILKRIGIHQPLSAKCLFHGTNPIPFIVLEDLRWSGFTLADRLQGLDMDHCKLVIKSHALFHASSIAFHEENPKALEFYKILMFNEDAKEEIRPFLENSFKAVEDTVLKWQGYERFSEKIKMVRETLFHRMAEASKHKVGKLNCLLHGDTWTNNLMFKYNDNTVEDVRLLDFQFSYYSSPTIDLQTFLTGCPNEEVRDNIDLLLKEYYDILADTLQKLKCKSKLITFEELKRDFDEHSIFGVQSAFTMIPFIMSTVPKNMNTDEVLYSSTMAVKCIEDISSGGVYERVMKKLLVKYENLGVI